MAAKFPVDLSELHAGDWTTWAQEGLQLAKDYVYADYDQDLHSKPTDEYLETRLPIIQERIMYGGARLAALISEIYGDAAKDPSILQ